jgi:hypothetical protein
MSQLIEIDFRGNANAAVAGEVFVLSVGFGYRGPVQHGGISIRAVILERREHGLRLGRLTLFGDDVQHIHFEREECLPPGTLEGGYTTHRMALAMPRRLPGSIDNGRTKIEFRVEVWVDLPWAIDARAEHVIDLVASAPSSLPDPVGHCSSAATSDELPVIECSYTPEYFVVGQPFECAIALTGGASDVEGVDVRLVQIEEAAVAESESVVETEVERWSVTRGAPSDGEALELRATIPARAAGGFETELTRVRHELEVRVLRGFGRARALRVPCVLLSRPMDESAILRALLVGSARQSVEWSALDAQLAARGATLISVNTDERSARWTIEGASVSIAVDRHRKLGLGVRVELRFDSLGIGLRIRDKSLLDGGANPPSMSAAFAARCALDVRDVGQLKAPVADALGDAALALSDCEVRDDRAKGWIAGALIDAVRLEQLIDRVCGVARSLRLARERIACPPSLATRRAAWSRFAERSSATLREGDLSIVGWTVRGVRCSIDWVFDDNRPTDVELRAALLGEVTDAAAEADALSAKLGRPVSVRDGHVAVTMGALDDPSECEPVAHALVAAMIERAHVSQGSYR